MRISPHQSPDIETSHSYSYSYYTPPQTKSQDRRHHRYHDRQRHQRRRGEPQFLQHRLFSGDNTQSFGLTQPWFNRENTTTTNTTSNNEIFVFGEVYGNGNIDESPTQAYLNRRQRRRLGMKPILSEFELEPKSLSSNIIENNLSFATFSPMQLCQESSLPFTENMALGESGTRQYAAPLLPSTFFAIDSAASRINSCRVYAENQELHARVDKLEEHIRLMSKMLEKVVAALPEDKKKDCYDLPENKITTSNSIYKESSDFFEINHENHY